MTGGGAMLTSEATVEFKDVECILGSSMAVLCVIGNKQVWIPRTEIWRGSQIRDRGERGKLVIPRRLAMNLELF
jgi:hypothetical protein